MGIWNAFLPIGGALKAGEAPSVDLVWLASRGISVEALSVLRCVRRDVLPLILMLGERHGLKAYSFLVHDRTSGVPCPAEDSAAYIHLRLTFNKKRRMSTLRGMSALRGILAPTWVYLRYDEPTDEPASGCVCATRGTGFCEVLEAQSAWYLRLVEREPQLDDLELLKQVRQHLHFLANMTQMHVQ